MLTARTHCNAHTEYAKFRSALELLETFELSTQSVDVAQATRASGGLKRGARKSLGDLEDHLDFVHSQKKEYQDFLYRYQRAMGIVLPKSNTNTDDKEPSRNQSSSPASSTCEELCIELEQIQKRRREDEEKRRQEDEKRRQEEDKRRQEQGKKYEMQLEEIRLKLEMLSSATRIETI